jgi:hypothetical protein
MRYRLGVTAELAPYIGPNPLAMSVTALQHEAGVAARMYLRTYGIAPTLGFAIAICLAQHHNVHVRRITAQYVVEARAARRVVVV